MDKLKPNKDPAFITKVMHLHQEYDQYSAEKDPAVGLFMSYWGRPWAEKFTHKFLFSLYQPPTDEPLCDKPPVVGADGKPIRPATSGGASQTQGL